MVDNRMSLQAVNAQAVNSVSNLSTNGLYDYCNSYYHYYPSQWYSERVVLKESTFDKAFKIVQKLMDKDLVKCDKVKDFVKLVSEVAEILN